MIALQKENSNFQMIATMTQMAKSKQGWTGETGYIRKDLLSKYLKGMENAVYYIAGPAAMVNGLHEVLNASGIDDDDIRIEEFAGY